VRVAQIGAGVIGSGWTAYLLARGVDVSAVDSGEGVEERLRASLDAAGPALERMGYDLAGWTEGLTFARSIDAAVEGVELVQENRPEGPQVTAELLAEGDARTAAAPIIASSSSGMLPSTLAAMARWHPERVVVGHPFNPVYLIALVEVAGAPDTPPDTVARALAFYVAIGKRPIHVRREVPGHLANRLQAALWREAYSLVERGVATVAGVDAAIAHGPGLRWALLGPFVNQHLSGGDGGLGPPTQKWMDDLGTPQLTPALAQLLVDGVDEELRGVDVVAMTTRRDALLVDLLAAKSASADLPP